MDTKVNQDNYTKILFDIKHVVIILGGWWLSKIISNTYI